MHIITENSDPEAVASPIGKSVVGKSSVVRYTKGILMKAIARILCINDNIDLFIAQK